MQATSARLFPSLRYLIADRLCRIYSDSQKSEVCPMPNAQCPMPNAQCPIVPHLSEKGYMLADSCNIAAATVFYLGLLIAIFGSDSFIFSCLLFNYTLFCTL